MGSRIIEERRAHSASVIAKVTAQVEAIPDVAKSRQLCIYATGSYARGDASPASDLDLFFIDRDKVSSKITMTLISAALIRICREIGLPEFSGDGRYLTVHKLEEIKENLGSQHDDYQNHFTARLLLLLESVPIAQKKTYSAIVKSIIESYYRDYHDHTEGFRPIFLVNDILRFWKTLCLNYEHKRNRPPRDQAEKIKSHLKNLKLKFSRMTTCFSTVLALVNEQMNVGPERLHEIVSQQPMERIARVADDVRGGEPIVKKIIDEYAWFLEHTGKPETVVLNWISKRNNRDLAFQHARDYGHAVFALLLKAAKDDDAIRYLIM